MAIAAAPEIDGFHSLSPLGYGPTSTIYSAQSNALGRWVALTVYSATLPRERAQRRFARQFDVARRLGSHPNVVTMLESGLIFDGQPWVATEIYERGTLQSRVDGRQPLSIDEALVFGIELAGALETAHRADVIHGGINPARVLLSHEGVPAVADLGLVALVDKGGLAVLVGPASLHAPPEVLEAGDLTPATDVYSLASTLYAALAGHAPYERADENTSAALLVRILQHDVPQIDRPDVPPSLLNVLRKALHAEPGRRPARMLAFARELQQLQVELGLPVTEPIVLDVAASIRLATAEEPRAAPVIEKTPPSGPPKRVFVPAPEDLPTPPPEDLVGPIDPADPVDAPAVEPPLPAAFEPFEPPPAVPEPPAPPAFPEPPAAPFEPDIPAIAAADLRIPPASPTPPPSSPATSPREERLFPAPWLDAEPPAPGRADDATAIDDPWAVREPISGPNGDDGTPDRWASSWLQSGGSATATLAPPEASPEAPAAPAGPLQDVAPFGSTPSFDGWPPAAPSGREAADPGPAPAPPPAPELWAAPQDPGADADAEPDPSTEAGPDGPATPAANTATARALPVIVLVALVVVLSAGLAWAVTTHDSDEPEQATPPDDTGTEQKAIGTDSTAAEDLGPVEVTAVENASGVQLDWAGATETDQVVLILSPTEAPRLLRASTGTALLVPRASLTAGAPYCFAVTSSDEKAPAASALAADLPAKAVTPPACIRGATPDNLRKS